METASAILNEVPEPLSKYRQGVSELLEHAVAKMLSKEAEGRYQLVHEVHTDLVAVTLGIERPSHEFAFQPVQALFCNLRKNTFLAEV